MMTNQPLGWEELGLGTLALVLFQILCFACPTPDLSAYVGAGVIYLPYPVHHVQSPPHPNPLFLSQIWA